jgi:SAM-dependent methyltransferase
LLALFFKLRTDVFHKKTNILHVSPTKDIANYIGENPNVTQVVGALEIDQFQEYDPIELDIQEMNLDSNQYDVVICCHVIEHVDDDIEAMREIYRVLKPKGFAVLQVPLALNLSITLEDKSLKTNKERKIAFGQIDHVRLYGMDYFDKLRIAGFRVVRDNPFDNKWLDGQELAKHRLDRIEDVIVAYKD